MGSNDNDFDDGAVWYDVTEYEEGEDWPLYCSECDKTVDELDNAKEAIKNDHSTWVGVCPDCQERLTAEQRDGVLYCYCGNTMSQHEKDTVGVCQECR